MRHLTPPGLLRPLSAFCLGVLVLFACEEPVDLQIDLPKSRLVITSSFVPHKPVVLAISATRPRGDTVPTEITDAHVTLFEGNTIAEELKYFPGKEGNGPGTYQTRDFVPEVGNQYTIHVSVPGYDPVTAVSSIPESVGIRSLTVSNLSWKEEPDEIVYDYVLTVDYADPEEEDNYYDLRVSQLVVPFEIDGKGDTLLRPAYLKSVGTPLAAVEANRTVSLLLKDKPSANGAAMHLQSRLDPSRELLGRVVAELRTVSPEYYFYQRSLAFPGDFPNTGLEEPVILYNNVDRGLGVFAGYNSVESDLVLFSE